MKQIKKLQNTYMHIYVYIYTCFVGGCPVGSVECPVSFQWPGLIHRDNFKELQALLTDLHSEQDCEAGGSLASDHLFRGAIRKGRNRRSRGRIPPNLQVITPPPSEFMTKKLDKFTSVKLTSSND